MFLSELYTIIKRLSEVVSAGPFQVQYRMTFETFAEKEQAFFREEFKLAQRSNIGFAGEREKEDLLSEHFVNIGDICFSDGPQDATANYEDIEFILINEDVWERKWLLYHELGH